MKAANVIPEAAITRTRQWVESVVIGLNFCPFARRELQRGSVRFSTNTAHDTAEVLSQLMTECQNLDTDASIETTLLILTGGFSDFTDYLDLIELAEALLVKQAYEGVYQIASFHPDYCFADSDAADAANYTNRSPYPMLHLLREDSLEIAISKHPNPDAIPETNIAKARALGIAYFRALLEK